MMYGPDSWLELEELEVLVVDWDAEDAEGDVGVTVDAFEPAK